MTNVHVLPAGHLSYDQARRLADDLQRAHENGVDLGSRLPHIRAAAGTFQRLAADLRLAVDKLVANASPDDRIDAHAVAALRLYIEGVEQLAAMAAMAACFPDQDPETDDSVDPSAESVLARAVSTAAR